MPSPFETLGLPARFDLSRTDIESAYLARVGAAHPDRAHGGMDAQQLSAELNAARATLANPESRAEALLSFAGGAPAGSERTLPEGFLSQMMELRESMEVDMASGDARALDRWHDYVNERRAHFIAMLSTLFSTPSPLGAEQRREIRMQLNAWRYIERLIEQLEPRASSQA